MDLKDVYSKQVKKTSVSSHGLGFGNNFPSIEKDPIINQLEIDVMRQLASLMPKEEIPIKSASPSIKILSPEDALKELIEMEKNMKIK
jgi:hypothetical protein